MIKSVHTEKAPKVVGPYSQAVTIGDLVFCSGQIGVDPKTGDLENGIQAQTVQALRNIHEVLKAAGSDMKYVLKTTIFITDMNSYATVNEVYAKQFGDHRPARSTVAVAALPKGALVEIEAMAIQPFDPGHDGCCGGESGGCVCGGNGACQCDSGDGNACECGENASCTCDENGACTCGDNGKPCKCGGVGHCQCG